MDKDYLSYLTSLSYEQLKREPEHLQQEQEATKSQLFSLVAQEYGSFLLADETNKKIRQGFSQLQDKTKSLLDNLPCLNNKLKLNHLQEREQLGLILKDFNRIEELLEIPFLIRTFTKNGYYEEAMDLRLCITRFTTRYQSSTFLKRLQTQVYEETDLMLAQLSKLLREQIKLPLCIRIIGYLRRMDKFPEPELRVLFLQQRSIFLRQLLSQLNQKDPYAYLKRYIEIYREHFYDTIIQYKAIFSDSNSVYISANSSNIFMNDQSSVYTQLILSSFVQTWYLDFKRCLESNVPLLKDSTLINYVMTQTIYYGISLGKVGIDFRLSIEPIFEDAIIQLIKELLEKGTSEFINWMTVGRLKGIQTRDSTMPLSGSQQTIAPPYKLMEFPGLAHLLNTFLTAFNQLRVLPLVGVSKKLANIIKNQFNEIEEKSRQIHEENQQKNVQDEFELFWETFEQIVVPCIVNGCIRIFSVHGMVEYWTQMFESMKLH